MIVPDCPAEAVGFIFVERYFVGGVRYDAPATDGNNPSATDRSGAAVDRSIAAPIRVGGRALGAEFFGSARWRGPCSRS